MTQISLRLSDGLAAQVKLQATRAGTSVNAWIALVLGAAVDPDLAGSEVERTRERLARAGLLSAPTRSARRPDQREVARARAAAGKGRELAQLVSDGRR